jgi:hypothetical protein
MKSHVTATFLRRFADLPPAVQTRARDDYRVFQRDPNYPGLNSHSVTRGNEKLYSVYTGIHYRALARERGGELYWFWIGHHAIYDAILAGR